MIKKYLKRDKYISSEKSQETIDDLRLIYYYSNGISKIINLLDNTPNQQLNLKQKIGLK